MRKNYMFQKQHFISVQITDNILGDHWDDVIARYKEIEVDITSTGSSDAPNNIKQTLQNLQGLIEQCQGEKFEFLPAHVIDLSQEGYIGTFYSHVVYFIST